MVYDRSPIVKIGNSLEKFKGLISYSQSSYNIGVMINAKKVRKAVIPAAGFGTRFLPATKAQPKEMLPIVDKPVIQYVVEQAVAAGIEQIIIVTGWHKRAIEDHFDRHFELEAHLEKGGKTVELAEIRKISELADFVYVRQKEPVGNGHAVLMAKDVIGDEPFVVMWGDEFFYGQPPAIKQLIEAYEQYNSPVIAGVRVAEQDVSRYGIADVTLVKDNVYEILEAMPASRGEIWLSGAIDRLIQKRDVYTVELKNNIYYDCGSKLNYLKAVVDFGLQHDDLRAKFAEYLRNLKV